MTPDVIVAGGGVIGTAIAHQLARRGARVTVLDHAAPGQATAASAAMIAPDADPGIGFRELAQQSARLYPALCAELLDRTGVDTGLRENALLLLAWGEEDERDLRRRRHRLEQAGVASAWLDPGRLPDSEVDCTSRDSARSTRRLSFTRSGARPPTSAPAFAARRLTGS